MKKLILFALLIVIAVVDGAPLQSTDEEKPNSVEVTQIDDLLDNSAEIQSDHVVVPQNRGNFFRKFGKQLKKVTKKSTKQLGKVGKRVGKQIEKGTKVVGKFAENVTKQVGPLHFLTTKVLVEHKVAEFFGKLFTEASDAPTKEMVVQMGIF